MRSPALSRLLKGRVQTRRDRFAAAALNLNFTSGSLDPRITFTRASRGSYFDSAGVLRQATYNLLTYSEQFDNAAWTKGNSSVSANAVVAPNGMLTADKLVENTANATHDVYFSGSFVTGLTYTFSVYIKAAERPTCQMVMGTGAFTESRTWFNLSTLTANTTVGAVSSASVTSVGNDWYRVSVSQAATATTTAPLYIRLFNGSTAVYTGDGTSGIYLWGAQLEASATAGPYYATTAAANGAPRFDYDPVTLAARGLLIEEQRTNLLLQSAAFDNAAWAKVNCTITADTINAPDGTQTADKIVETAATGFHNVNPASSVTVTSAAPVVTSVFAKSAERTSLGIFPYSSAAGAKFDLSNGTVISQDAGVTATITAAGNGWYRCTASITAPGTTAQPWILPLNASNATNYAGDITKGIYIWGAQLEAGAFATSYIPTAAAQATRIADSATMTGTNFSSWYNASEGSFYAEMSSSATAGSLGVFAVGDATLAFAAADTIYITRSGTSGQVSASILDNGASQASITAGTLSGGSVGKFASAYKVNDFAAVLNAGSVSTDTSGTVPTPTSASIGSLLSGWTGASNYINGHIRRIAYYPRRLSNAELQGITT